eukprot:TRINITY_DN4748_c0_g1_i4.p1 TRINITY_DN4748_c0_g1~~TRINITY_DN4748_c0_g1_i4.p1  ORF type:complete len:161 (+),score=9.67 TRINITY_DN4748_c0_g1_i4:288-770(+)
MMHQIRSDQRRVCSQSARLQQSAPVKGGDESVNGETPDTVNLLTSDIPTFAGLSPALCFHQRQSLEATTSTDIEGPETHVDERHHSRVGCFFVPRFFGVIICGGSIIAFDILWHDLALASLRTRRKNEIGEEFRSFTLKANDLSFQLRELYFVWTNDPNS